MSRISVAKLINYAFTKAIIVFGNEKIYVNVSSDACMADGD
jgi:hypothetical protein